MRSAKSAGAKAGIDPSIKDRATQGAAAVRNAATQVADVLKPAERVQSGRNLKRIAEAMRKYHDVHGQYPPAASRGADGTPLLSWRVLVLPHLGDAEATLYKEFHPGEPWDSPHNATLLPRMPSVYAPPGAMTEEPYLTYYQVFIGPGTVFEGGVVVTMASVSDGPDKTLLAVEAGEPVPWTKPQDLPYAPDEPLPRLGFFKGHFLAVYCSGKLQGFVRDVALVDTLLRAIITRDGGEPTAPTKSNQSAHHWDFDD